MLAADRERWKWKRFDIKRKQQVLLWPDPVPLRESTIGKFIATFFSGRCQGTREGYRSIFRRICAYNGVPDLEALAEKLFKSDACAANVMAEKYKNHLCEQGLAPATINLRLSALYAFVRHANRCGLAQWMISVERLPAEPRRDMRGPGFEAIEKMLSAAVLQGGERALRDAALLWLMWSLALREGECAKLSVEDVDFQNGEIWVLGKMRLQKTKLSLPPRVLKALREWIRDRKAGPVFHSFHRARSYRAARLSGKSIDYIVQRVATAAGVGKVRPHGIRHSAITAALDSTTDLRAVMQFSRHRDVNTLMLYDDRRNEFPEFTLSATSFSVSSEYFIKRSLCEVFFMSQGDLCADSSIQTGREGCGLGLRGHDVRANATRDGPTAVSPRRPFLPGGQTGPRAREVRGGTARLEFRSR